MVNWIQWSSQGAILKTQNKHLIRRTIIFALVSIFFFGLNETFGQNVDPIDDFYQYANSDWLDSTVVKENISVVNNWGLLWDRIIDKSIEILSGDSQYDLDEKHLFLLTQLQNFYKSTIEYSNDERKRVALVQNHYPMPFGILFSKITVSEAKENQVNEIIGYLNTAYHDKIEKSNRIGEYHRDLFLAKLDNMTFEIGAPALSKFPRIPTLSSDSLEKNIQFSKEYQIEMDRVKSDWETPPFETDCFYTFHDNKVKIYAGILYDSILLDETDYTYLFATLGRTIGHEMTHAFDIIGKNYNQDGEYINWLEKLFWGAYTSKNDWDNIYQALIELYNQYAIQDTLFVNGTKTLQENIADLGGVEISLLALKIYLEKTQPLSSEKDELEALRKYFIAYAQFWREKATPAFEHSSLKRLHTPQKFRAIGPIYNQNEFYEVFEIDEKSEYYIPAGQRINIW